jgi:hypothetical protein
MALPRGGLRKAGAPDEDEISDDIELADSFGSRFWGLMGRRAMAIHAGLWLTGTSSIHMLFMRFSIDAVFLGQRTPDGSRPVLAIRSNLRPWTSVVWLVRGAEICLELPAGVAATAALAVGDQLIYTLDH